VLLTSSTRGMRDCGSGFVISRDDEAAYVATCNHVLEELRSDQQTLTVNGLVAEEYASGAGQGIDLAIVRVKGLDVAPAPIGGKRSKSGSPVGSHGFYHLHGNHYLRSTCSGKVGSTSTMRSQLDRASAVESIEIRLDKNHEIRVGNSGSPIIEVKSGEVIGVLAFRSADGRIGYALGVSALRQIAPGLLGLGPTASERTGPPPLPPVTHPRDPQRGRFGGRRSDGFVTLEAEDVESFGESHFRFDATVRPERKGVSLVGPARFHLHDSFPRSIVSVRKVDSRGRLTLRDISSYGVFVVGCQVRDAAGSWHAVEIDLDELSDLPKIFHER